ncbi:hypothetical protein NL676_025134 [Syzygium grande]|nr:hypothetical protein NL676_025134 [Syzygium grande]
MINRGAGTSAASEHPKLWIHEGSGLLRPIFRFLKVDERSWDGLKETAGSSSQVRHHVGATQKKVLIWRTDKLRNLRKLSFASFLVGKLYLDLNLHRHGGIKPLDLRTCPCVSSLSGNRVGDLIRDLLSSRRDLPFPST